MRRGTWLLLAAGLVVFTGHLVRDRLKQPVTFFYEPSGQGSRIVELGAGFCPSGVHQFFDGRLAQGANSLTTCLPRHQHLLKELLTVPPISGEHFEIIEKSPSEASLGRSWMTAARRLAVGVTLHPDRMSLTDWIDLPGIGPVTAEKIEKSRQFYGDFGRVEGLQRVPGVGPVTIRRLRPLFE